LQPNRPTNLSKKEDVSGFLALSLFIRESLSIKFKLKEFAEDRLERMATGDILYKLKEAWNDGTIGIRLSPSELIEKLASPTASATAK
jgi:hypothetical protein